jgi:hypothetical protein
MPMGLVARRRETPLLLSPFLTVGVRWGAPRATSILTYEIVLTPNPECKGGDRLVILCNSYYVVSGDR